MWKKKKNDRETQNHATELKEWYLVGRKLKTLQASSNMSKVGGISKTVPCKMKNDIPQRRALSANTSEELG